MPWPVLTVTPPSTNQDQCVQRMPASQGSSARLDGLERCPHRTSAPDVARHDISATGPGLLCVAYIQSSARFALQFLEQSLQDFTVMDARPVFQFKPSFSWKPTTMHGNADRSVGWRQAGRGCGACLPKQPLSGRTASVPIPPGWAVVAPRPSPGWLAIELRLSVTSLMIAPFRSIATRRFQGPTVPPYRRSRCPRACEHSRF